MWTPRQHHFTENDEEGEVRPEKEEEKKKIGQGVEAATLECMQL